MLASRSVQSYKKWSFFSVFTRLGLFPYVFAQVKEWLVLELHEMIRMLHAVAYPVTFNLLCDLGQQLGVLEVLLF